MKKIAMPLLLVFVMFSLAACSADDAVENYGSATVGSYIRFGTYEQDNNQSNGNESIKWLVLAKEDYKLLVISKDNLAYRQFHGEYVANTVWENCDLRTWLNEEFLQDAFSVKERDAILTTSVGVDISVHGDEFQGNGTQDKIFILSASEAEMYFAEDSDRIAQNTESVKKYLSEKFFCPGDSDEHCWWLRTRAGGIQFGDGSLTVASDFVDDNGCINDRSTLFIESSGSHTSYYGIRPVLWIDLNSWQE